LAKEAQDPAKPNIFSTSGILVTNFQSPFLSFYSNDFEFISGFLRSRTRTGKFPGFSYGSFSYTVKKMEFRWRKKWREMKGISNAHWAAEAPSCQEHGLGPHITVEKYFLMNFQTINYETLILNIINSHYLFFKK
jgi:hypothetical protein